VSKRKGLPDHVDGFTDRHGHPRYYFRRGHGRRVPLPGAPWSDAFMAAYYAALHGDTPRRPPPPGAGTVAAAIAGFLASAPFLALAPDTQRQRRRILERLREKAGGGRIATIAAQDVERWLAARAATPEAARNLLKALRPLMRWCVLSGLRSDDPTAGLSAPRKKTPGYYTWTEADVAAFRARHPLGTRARLALELAAGTGQRRGDLVRIGRQHVRGGILSLRQAKTGVQVDIPLLPELQAAIDAMPAAGAAGGTAGGAAGLTFLHTHTGEAFSPPGFTNWFRDMRAQAGLARGSAHGLRKYAATRHADAGATAHQLMAWFGWETLAEAERYTRQADRRRLSAEIGAKLSGTPIPNPDRPRSQPGAQPRRNA
jgi:integrase